MTNETVYNRIQFLERSIAVLIAAVFLFGMLFSALFIAEESLHDCSGEDCPICQMIAQCESFVKRISPAIILAVLAFFSVELACTYRIEACSDIVRTTPLSLRVRLNN